jgi:ketosteroid isomerase-like protein
VLNIVIAPARPATRPGGGTVAGPDVVARFEHAFKNEGNHGIVDELMTEDFVHHLPYAGLPPGRAGMRMVGEQIAAAIHDIQVTVDLVLSDGDLVADRVSAAGVRTDTGAPITWVENHIYRMAGDRIAELWPAGGPQL